jgi:hypothetical protein
MLRCEQDELNGSVAKLPRYLPNLHLVFGIRLERADHDSELVPPVAAEQ